MKKRTNWSLQRFAEDPAPAAVETAPAATETGGVPAAGTNPAGEVNTATAAQRATFDELLNDPEYKREYDSRVNRAVMGRMKKAKAEREALYPMLTMLGTRYGIDVSDPAKMDMQALSNAIMADDTMLEQEAADRGLTTDALRQIKAAERETAKLRRQQEEAENEQRFNALLAEEQKLKEVYPQFSLAAEMQNEQFGNLLFSLQQSGFANALQTAYEAVHKTEIIGGAMQYATQKTKEQVSQSIQSNVQRPRENGGGSGAAETKFDPSKMSDKQYEDIRARVARGEKIVI